MNNRITNQNNPPFVQNGGNTHRAITGAQIKHMVHQIQNMGRFSCGTGNKSISVTMGKHKCRKHVAVTRSEAVHIRLVKPFALQPFIQERFIHRQMRRVFGVHHLKLSVGIAHPCCSQQVLNISLTSDDQRLAKARPLILNSSTQYPWIISFGENHPRLRTFCPRMNAPQNRRGWVHS